MTAPAFELGAIPHKFSDELYAKERKASHNEQEDQRVPGNCSYQALQPADGAGKDLSDCAQNGSKSSFRS